MTLSSSHNRQQGFIIAIDGPVASGKGTIAPRLAKMLHGFCMDTGAMFRCLALYCIEHQIAFDDQAGVEKSLSKVHIELLENKIILNGEDVSGQIRTAEVGRGASPVSAYPKVREIFPLYQRELAEKKIHEGKIVVAEGRDLGTNVFPNAAVKIYMTATLESRAKRRLQQLQAKGESIRLDQVIQETRDRDNRDTTRAISPLTTEPEKYGYFIIDNTTLSEEETLNAIMSELKRKGLL